MEGRSNGPVGLRKGGTVSWRSDGPTEFRISLKSFSNDDDDAVPS